MEKHTTAQEQSFLTWMAQELGELKPFKPVAWYDKNFDWFIFMGQDASYTEVTTSSPHLELFKDNQSGKIVGMKVLEFTSLPRELRYALMETTGDTAIENIEHIWIHTMHEIAPEISAFEVDFFRELKARGLDDEEKAQLQDLQVRFKKNPFG
jgi:hypothetical protein